MRFKISAVVAIAAMYLINPANAGFFTGEKLLALCESGSASKNRACEMYLVGVADGYDGLQRLGSLTSEYFCLAKGVSLPQVREIFVNYANDNPRYSKLPASRLVIGALAKAFPCK